MLIDSHQHYWQIGKHGHTWPMPDLDAIYRDFGIEDFLQETADVSIAGTIAVQSQPSDADTDWLMQMGSDHSLVKGVVGWVDLAAANATSRLTELAHHRKFKGVRPMLQSLVDDRWILRDEVQPALETLSELDLCFDALIFTRHLGSIAELARRWPELRIVIDHAAKPPIAQCSAKVAQQWRDAMAQVAECANVSCKLSGLFTEMSAEQSYDAAIPYAEHVFKVFGAERVIWGSDWPVLKLRNSYLHWHAWTMKRISHFSPAQQAKIMGGNAQRIYKL